MEAATEETARDAVRITPGVDTLYRVFVHDRVAWAGDSEDVAKLVAGAARVAIQADEDERRHAPKRGGEHTAHDDSHHSGLDDNCPRCREAIQEPTNLDASNLLRIWSGTIITKTDLAVFNVLYRSVVITQRLAEAVAWKDFEPGRDSILSFVPGEKPNQYELFQHGGRA